MLEREPHGLERDSAGELPLRAIFSIAHDRMPRGSELDADLMASPGPRFDLQQCCVGKRFESAKRQAAFPRPYRRLRHGSHDIRAAVLHEPIDEQAFPCGHAAFDEGFVNFLHSALSELFGQSPRGFARPREQNDPRHGSIEPMDNSHKHISRLVIALAKVLAREIDQRHVSAAIADGQKASRLVDGQAVIVFVEDSQLVVLDRRVALPPGHRITKSLIEGALSGRD
jgi:hypothetical protein